MPQTEYSGVLTIVEKCVEHVVESRTERNTFMMCCARLKNKMPPWRASIIHGGLGVQIYVQLRWCGVRNEGVHAVVVHLLRMQELALRIRHAVFMPNKYYIESFCQRGFTTIWILYTPLHEKNSAEEFTAQTSSMYGTTTDNLHNVEFSQHPTANF